MLQDICLILGLWAVSSAPFVLFVLKTSGSVKLTEEEMIEFGWI